MKEADGGDVPLPSADPGFARQSVRDPGDDVTGVLPLTSTHGVTAGRHAWRGGKHVRRSLAGPFTVLVVVPLLGIAAVVPALPVGEDRPAPSVPQQWGMGRPDPTGWVREPALISPESPAPPAPHGSDPSTPDAPGAATVGPSPTPSPPTAATPSPTRPARCTRSWCLPWLIPGPSAATPSTSPTPSAPSPSGGQP